MVMSGEGVGDNEYVGKKKFFTFSFLIFPKVICIMHHAPCDSLANAKKKTAKKNSYYVMSHQTSLSQLVLSEHEK